MTCQVSARKIPAVRRSYQLAPSAIGKLLKDRFQAPSSYTSGLPGSLHPYTFTLTLGTRSYHRPLPTGTRCTHSPALSRLTDRIPPGRGLEEFHSLVDTVNVLKTESKDIRTIIAKLPCACFLAGLFFLAEPHLVSKLPFFLRVELEELMEPHLAALSGLEDMIELFRQLCRTVPGTVTGSAAI